VIVSGQHFGVCAFGALELLSGSDFNRRFVCNSHKVHSNILTIHMFVDPFLDSTRHGICIHITPEFVMEGSSSQYHRNLISPFGLILPALSSIVPNVN
uniref:Uncharacterized protein n=1 Tax=Megaselia scalaris TaxID=36166 RepID=T1H6P2_MEGSC